MSAPKTVRCKMICDSVTSTRANERPVHQATFTPVSGGSPENDQFFRWTPGGKLELSVLNSQHFEPGREYYVDLTPAE